MAGPVLRRIDQGARTSTTLELLFDLCFVVAGGTGCRGTSQRHYGIEAGFVWGYSHLLVWASIAAFGAGLQIATESLVGHGSVRIGTMAMTIPLAMLLPGSHRRWSFLQLCFSLWGGTARRRRPRWAEQW